MLVQNFFLRNIKRLFWDIMVFHPKNVQKKIIAKNAKWEEKQKTEQQGVLNPGL